MDKFVFVIVLFLIALGICGVVSHFSTLSADMATVADRQLERQTALQATIAAATPSAVEIVNQNRLGLHEAGVQKTDGGWGIVIFLALIIVLLLFIALMQNSEGTLKQLRLIQKQLGGGQRRPAPGRARTIPQIPYLGQQPRYRELPEQSGQMPQEVDWYE